MNGVPELVVLELLSRRPMYGYELVQAIKDESSGALEFGEGCIYPLLHKLEARGDLSSRRLDVGGRSRVVYRVTPKGTKQRAASMAQWSTVMEAVGNILQGGKHEHAESLNGMVSDLIRRGLPVDYAERAAAEFADHHRDLVEELQITGLANRRQ